MRHVVVQIKGPSELWMMVSALRGDVWEESACKEAEVEGSVAVLSSTEKVKRE